MAKHRSSFSVWHKALRVLWGGVWLLFFRASPRFAPFWAWRRALLRLFGGQIGSHARVYPSCRIWAPWRLTMEASSCLGPQVDCYSVDKISIGKAAVISQYAVLCTATHDIDDPEWKLRTAPIEIGPKAWVAAGAFVGPGVLIGEGAVVGARAVVVKDAEAWAVVVGNPARVIRKRTRC